MLLLLTFTSVKNWQKMGFVAVVLCPRGRCSCCYCERVSNPDCRHEEDMRTQQLDIWDEFLQVHIP